MMRKASLVTAAALLVLGVAAQARAQQQGPHHEGMTGPGMMMGMDPDDWGGTPMMMHMREMMMGQGPMPMMGMGMGQHIEGGIAFLKAELKVTPAQEQLWGAFAETVGASARKVAGMMRHGGTTTPGAMPTLPERLDRQEQLLVARLDALRAMRGALTPLYAAFSDEQKQAADQLIRGPMGMGMVMGTGMTM